MNGYTIMADSYKMLVKQGYEKGCWYRVKEEILWMIICMTKC